MNVSAKSQDDTEVWPALIDQAYDELGGVKHISQRTGISERTLRTWEQRPSRSGREPTVQGILEILSQMASEPLNVKLRAIAREICSRFTAKANLRISTDDPAAELRYVLDLLERRALLPPKIKPYHCPECGHQLQIQAFVGGVPVFGKCEKCTRG